VGVNKLTVAEGIAVEVSGIIGSLFIVVLVLLLVVRQIMQLPTPDDTTKDCDNAVLDHLQAESIAKRDGEDGGQ